MNYDDKTEYDKEFRKKNIDTINRLEQSNNDIISIYPEGILTNDDFMLLIGANNSNKNVEGYQLQQNMTT